MRAEAKLDVLVVDDDESFRDSLKMLLESDGYRVVTFESAEDFLDSDCRQATCCLVLDIRLPGMSGLDLHKHLLKSQPRIPVIFVTGQDVDQAEKETVRLGAIAYLRKPFDKNCLLEAIRRAFENGD